MMIGIYATRKSITSRTITATNTSSISVCSAVRTTIRTSTSTSTSSSTSGSTSGSTSNGTARSVYVSQIRRAFLLRVHPDRFRHMNTTTSTTTTTSTSTTTNVSSAHASTSIQQQYHQQQQASLVKALATRMNEYDFKQWQLGYNNNTSTTNTINSMSSNSIYPFIMERRDGSYINYQLNLSTTVEIILQDMVKALQLSGATTPSIPISTNTSNNTSYSKNNTSTDSHNNTNMFYYNGISSSSNNVDRRYDKVSQQGRSIRSFLLNNNNTMSSSTSTSTSTSTSYRREEDHFGSSKQQQNTSLTLIEQIQQRKLYRIDAQALAREIRTVYQFQSIDATQTGWSSQSICIVLRRFLDMYDDYSSTLNVSSFYPLRLIFAPSIEYIINTNTNNNNNINGNDVDDDTSESTHDHNNNNNNNNTTIQLTDHVFDMYEGIIRLHPAWTTNQWLTIIRLIQPYHIQNVHNNILQRQYYTNKINTLFGIKIKKGFSCSSSEYNIFLQSIYQSIVQKQKQQQQQQAEEEEEEDDQTQQQQQPSQQQQSIVDTMKSTGSLVDHTSSTSLVTIEDSKYVVATIESSYSIRRRSSTQSVVLSTGQIQLHNLMNLYDCTTTIQKLLPTAIQYSVYHNTIMKQQIQQIIIQLQINLGIQRIYKASNFVTYEQYYNTLHRLLQTLFIEPNTSTDNNGNNNNDEQQQQDFELLKRQLSGNSLGISVEGQFCHLADDGSILIPHNWTI